MRPLTLLWPGITLTLLVLAGWLVWNPFTLDKNTAYANVAQTYLAELARNGGFRGAALVAQNGQIVFEGGYQDSRQTRFPVGSITKQFTALAILQLVEAGKLHLQDRVCQYVPDCPAAWQPVSLEHLLTHTSGIPDDPPGLVEDVSQAQTIEQVWPFFASVPLKFSPGVQYSYSNVGYVLLGYVVQQVSGQSYPDYMQNHIFGPLNLQATSFECSGPDCATGYTRQDGKTLAASPFDLRLLLAAGGLYSTVADLYRWEAALYTARLVSSDLLQKMFTVQAGDQTQGYGYGWNITRLDGRPYFWHAGLLPGFKSVIGRLPDQKLTVVVLSNQDSGPNGVESGLISRYFHSEILTISRPWVGLAALLAMVWAGLVLLKILLVILRQPGQVAWKQSLWLAGGLPLAGSAALLTVGLILNKTPWRWEGFGPTTGERLVETIVPLLAGVGAAFLLSPEDEPALEVTLACRRPFRWLLLERVALLLTLHLSVGLLGSLATVVLGESREKIELMVGRWVAPTFFLVGIALCATLVTRQVASGVGLTMLVWFGTLLGGAALLERFPWLWALHPYLQPGQNYLLNRVTLGLAGLYLIALATYLISDEERVLLGVSQRRLRTHNKQEALA